MTTARVVVAGAHLVGTGHQGVVVTTQAVVVVTTPGQVVAAWARAAWLSRAGRSVSRYVVVLIRGGGGEWWWW
jgi:hypothetical protein